MSRALRPESARWVLNAGLILWMLGGASSILLGLIFLWTTASSNATRMTLFMPYQTRVRLPGKLELKGAELGNALTVPGWLPLTLGLLSIAFGVLWLIWGQRARAFVSRLLEDPFHTSNVTDLLAASRAALWFAALYSAGWVMCLLLWPPQKVARQLADSLEGLQATVSVSAYPPPVFWPMVLAWAVCAVLASVFQRGHDLHGEERRLRTEQELTV